MVVVHSVLPDDLGLAVEAVLGPADVPHVRHGTEAPVQAAATAAGDAAAVAVIGPCRSADVAEAVEATAPAGLPLLAPIATWAGVTRHDEPGCDDPARHEGTVVRLVARDTVVAARLSAHLKAAGRHALVVAGEHRYGRQLDGQLRLGGLPRTADPGEADVVVLCGLAGEPEIRRAAALAPLPLVAFDGVQGADLGAGREVQLALPLAPEPEPHDAVTGAAQAQRAAELVVAGLSGGAHDRPSLLAALRELGHFDEHGDPVNPPVWLWRAERDWALRPGRPI